MPSSQKSSLLNNIKRPYIKKTDFLFTDYMYIESWGMARFLTDFGLDVDFFFADIQTEWDSKISLALGLSLNKFLCTYFVYASNECSGETVLIHRLV